MPSAVVVTGTVLCCYRFGLNSRFDDCFPPGLVGKVSGCA